MFELVVKLAPADGNPWLNCFKERFRISWAICTVMRKKQDIYFTLETLAAPEVCAEVMALPFSALREGERSVFAIYFKLPVVETHHVAAHH
ncbi:MAG: hypothetical protein ACYCY5_01400 [Sulfuricella sp.]